MVTLLGYLASAVATVAGVIGFAALLVLSIVTAPIGGICFLYYAAKSLFDETEFRNQQMQAPLNPA